MTQPTCPVINAKGDREHLFVAGQRTCLCGARTELETFIAEERKRTLEGHPVTEEVRMRRYNIVDEEKAG